MKKTAASPSELSAVRGPISSFFYQLQVTVIVAFLLATLYTAWTPAGLLPGGLGDQFSNFVIAQPTSNTVSETPTASPRPKVGIVAGHWGSDSGAVCPDGLTEVDINLNVATLVKKKLTDQGYDVDVLKEFDALLDNYRASALVSIHSDSCTYVNDQATGFKVAAALGNKQTQLDKAARLTACLRTRYGAETGLRLHTSITPDMTYYHAFDEIHEDTTAAIIEIGFMNLDRQILTQSPDRIAQGIVNGILCYLNNEDIGTVSSP
jgi:N-acetylmuramoyl-L-alanine amidase